MFCTFTCICFAHKQFSKNPPLPQLPGDFSKSLNTIGAISEESPEHKHSDQEDPFEAEFRGRSRSAALTQEPKELGLMEGISGSSRVEHKNHSLKCPVPTGNESTTSLLTLDKCSNIMDDDTFDFDESYEVLLLDEEDGDPILFGDSVMIEGSCSTNPATENGCGPHEDGVRETSASVKFPVSSSALLQSFYFRLEHVVLNIPDFPPAQTFVK